MRASILLLPALAAAVLVGGCDRQKADQPQAQADADAGAAAAPKAEAGKVVTEHKGDSAPAAAFVDAADKPVTIKDLAGKPLLVNLWATWCAPCVAEMPTLDKLAAQRAGKLQVIAISQDMEGRRAVTPFFAKKGFTTLKPYLDKENGLMLALKADTLPITILYDGQGKEVWRVIGAMDWTSPKAVKLLDEATAT